MNSTTAQALQLEAIDTAACVRMYALVHMCVDN
jgi:hypothetical protein